jgi:S1-C subfamily serine protease
MKLAIIPLLALSLHATAQRGLQMPDPLESLSDQQKSTLVTQARQFFHAARPAVAEAAKSTVIISHRGVRLSYGTAVKLPNSDQNVILTKWSEIAQLRSRLIVTAPSGKYYRASVVGVYPEYDIAMLSSEVKLTPLDLSDAATPGVGEFIALASPDGSVQSLGVVSVLARSLRDSDKAYLGVLMDFENSNQFGTPLQEVVPQSPAAIAGLKEGDIVTAVGNKPVKGAMEMRNTLQKLVPGSEILVSYRRDKKEHQANVRLASRPKELDPSRVAPERMNQMQQMGAVPNVVRHDFPWVIQSDMPIQADETPQNPRDNFTNECGGPVVDLDGKVVGIIVARGSRIKTYIIPTSTIITMLNSPQKSNSASSGAQTARYSKSKGRNQRSGPNSRRKQPPRAIPVDE